MLAGCRRLGVAVSGGGDSVALLHLLAGLAPRLGVALVVLHLDHGLRGEESRQDAGFVAEVAGSLGLPVESRAVPLAGSAGNLEQAARDARREFFRDAMARGLADRVATGHTRSDQAETVLFRMLRGSGLAGLAGILPVTSEGLIRPLLEISREECREYLAARGLPWRDDSSNRDQRLRRNRIRHTLLPTLAADYPEAEAALARLATLARDEESYWRPVIEEAAAATLVRDGAALILPVARLRELPAAVARRLVREALARVRGGLRRIEMDHVERVLALAAGDCVAGSARLPGAIARRSFDWIRVAAPPDLPAAFAETVPAPGCARVPGATIRLDPVDYRYNTDGCCLDRERVSFPLTVRNWRPGDWFQPAGVERPRKMKDLFQKARVPSWERYRWPILAGEGAILWTRRFGVSASAAASPATRHGLRVIEEVEG
jgi:tRNA(Ile)-lysidine synthase